MTATTATLNQAAGAITVTQMSLHSGPPTALGNVNELVGGGYQRQNVTLGAPVNGVVSLAGQPVFNVAAGASVSHYVLWDGATPKEYGQFTGNAEVFTNAGTYKVNSGSITITSP